MVSSPGSRFGSYEILGPLGAGGMGEVFRAKDTRLGREVALKLLPEELAQDADRLRRFEQEARAASALNHPSIVTVYEVGSTNGTSYLAMELVLGRTLREVLEQGPLPARRVLDLAAQLAEGLAKAHAAGIVHRDLKPANVMVSSDGFAKILDFGIAKLTRAGGLAQDETAAPTIDPGTVPGTVLGTVGYMSPEQARAQPVDFRSDQFSFGSMLYEMATGRRAFQRGTSAETLTAIIREEPEPLARLAPQVPAPLRWIVERCLAKDPEDRYASTKDLARDLKSVRDHISEVSGTGAAVAVPQPKRARRLLARAALALGLLAAGAAAMAVLRRPAPLAPRVRQITFRRGTVWRARIGPDGRVIYSAAWEGAPMEVFENRPGSPESRSLGLHGADILAISDGGDLALSVKSRSLTPFLRAGTLATLSLAAAGAPRELLDDVYEADYAPDGKSLAIVHATGGRSRLELPPGKVLHEMDGWMAFPRVFPDGERVAFLEHPVVNDNGGFVSMVDRGGKVRRLAGPFDSVNGLAIPRDGREVFFTAAKAGSNQALWAVTASGRARLVYQVPGQLVLQDIGKDGSFLLNRELWRVGLVAKDAEGRERDLSWLDWSLAVALSHDGRKVLFAEAAEGGGPGYSIYVRGIDGSPAVRLGEGYVQAFSPDEKWVLAILHATSDPQLVLYPSGTGEMRMLDAQGLSPQLADFLPDGKSLVVSATEPGHGVRVYVRALEGGKPRPISPEGFRLQRASVSPDASWVLAAGPDRRVYRLPLGGEGPVPVAGIEAGETASGLSADGRTAYTFKRGERPMRVFSVDPQTGRRELWKELSLSDPAGVNSASRLVIARDGKSCVYSFQPQLSEPLE